MRACVRYIVELMVRHEYERGTTDRELAEVWERPLSTIQNYTAEAGRHLDYLGEREYWMRRIRAEADARLTECKNTDFAAIARVAADTVGGFSAKQEITHSITAPPSELVTAALLHIAESPELHTAETERLLVEALERVRDSRALPARGESGT